MTTWKPDLYEHDGEPQMDLDLFFDGLFTGCFVTYDETTHTWETVIPKIGDCPERHFVGLTLEAAMAICIKECPVAEVIVQ